MSTCDGLRIVEFAETVPRETPMGNMLHNERRIVVLDWKTAGEMRAKYGGLMAHACVGGAYALQQRIVRSDLTEPLPWETFNVAPPSYLRQLCAESTSLTGTTLNVAKTSAGVLDEERLGDAERTARDAASTAELAWKRTREIASDAYAAALKKARIFGKAQRGEAPADKVAKVRASVQAEHGPKIDDAHESMLFARASAAEAVEAAAYPRYVH